VNEFVTSCQILFCPLHKSLKCKFSTYYVVSCQFGVVCRNLSP